MNPVAAPILSARSLRKSYGCQEVLRGIDLDLAAGHVTVVLGENGAGKSTLLRVLAGDLRPSAGEVSVDGHSVGAQPDTARARLVYVAQHPPLAPLLTLREHAEAMGAFRGLGRDAAQASLTELSTALRLDLQTGIRIGWYIPFYSKKPKDFYYN